MESTARFAATLLNAATEIHYLHLSTRSYAAHVALGELYGALPDLVDRVVELCQGRHGLIDSYPAQEVQSPDPKGATAYVSALSAFVEECRKELPQETEIQNAVDDVAAAIDGALYKLRFLS